MSAILTASFLVGVAFGIYRLANPARPKIVNSASNRKNRSNTHLDTVDHMFLYGEVTNDDFYRM